MNLRGELRSFVAAHDGREPEELAVMFARLCTVDDLVPLLIDEIKALERARVRFVEIESLRLNATGPRRLGDRRLELGALAALLDKPYRIGDGRVRNLGEMSIDDHRARIVMLRANIMGLQRDIAVHEDAIAVLEAHGASCLNEIGGQIAA